MFLNSNSDGILLNIILPVGISFYTFQALSYSIDVYRGKLEPTKDIIAFFAYVSFFPQLVAGPIERATNLLPQFQHTRVFNYNQAVDGMRQMLWGFFKGEQGLEFRVHITPWLRYPIYYALIMMCIICSPVNSEPFIYFQF